MLLLYYYYYYHIMLLSLQFVELFRYETLNVMQIIHCVAGYSGGGSSSNE